jgi:hypothetical protein
MERGPFGHIIERVKAFKANAGQIILEEAKEEEAVLVDLNQEGQLAQGYGSDGKAIKPFYTEYTKLAKGLKGQPSEFVTLYDEGDFYAGFEVNNTKNGLEFGSTDEKTPDLLDKYGQRIFGLDNDNLQDFIDEYLRQRAVNRFRKEIFN